MIDSDMVNEDINYLDVFIYVGEDGFEFEFVAWNGLIRTVETERHALLGYYVKKGDSSRCFVGTIGIPKEIVVTYKKPTEKKHWSDWIGKMFEVRDNITVEK